MQQPSDEPGAPGPSPHEPRRNRLTRVLVILCAIGFVVLLAAGLLLKSPDDSIDQALSEGRGIEAPPFELAVLDEGQAPGRLAGRLESAMGDGSLSLSELRGSPLVVNFWASWCTPCREEASQLEAAWREAGPEGVIFLGLNMQDFSGDALDFIEEFGATYPSVRDPSDSVANAWGVTGIPETFFVSAEGEVVGHVIGVVSAEQLSAGIDAAKLGSPTNAVPGGPQGATR